MLRITGGICKGAPIRAPRRGVRPTQDRVREAVFSMLAAVVPGCRFLDLFAGSGALGLEALSRGARFVMWVERDGAAYRLLKSNVASAIDRLAGDGPTTRCVRQDVMACLRRQAITAFDVIYADPPYAALESPAGTGIGALTTRLLSAIRRGGWLAPGGIVVVEMGVRGGAGIPDGWDLITTRHYGNTVLAIYKEKQT